MVLIKLLILLCVVSAAVLVPIESETRNDSTPRSFRLPNDTIPLHYDLRISTEIHRGDFVFDGHVRVHIRAVESTDTITLHYRQLILRRVNLLNVDGSVIRENVPFRMLHDLEFLEIPATLTANQELIVEVMYTGILRDDATGFFRSSYVDPESTERIWLASTHFKTTDSRHAFPCYDEVGYRTTFQLQINHHRSYRTISNMPIEAQGATGDYFTTIFQISPRMPTHLLTFTVSNFDFISSTASAVPMQVFAQPPAIARGEADHSLAFGFTVSQLLEERFGRYSLPLLNQIAIPGLSWSTAPKWGLITYREDFLLQLQNEPDNVLIAREIRIAHVFSHNYFGNLVSPVWWSFLWLNEGFASFYEILLVDELHPERNLWVPLSTTSKDALMFADVNDALVPLNLYAESPDEIEFKSYNVIVTHDKAVFILRMMMFALSRATFEKGTRYYLTTRAYQSASPDDLHAGLQRAADEDFPGSNLNIREIMRPWENFAGYPIVNVRLVGSSLVVSQEGFTTSHDTLFHIPISYATASNPASQNQTPDFWLTSQEVEISQSNAPKGWSTGDWILMNLGNFGYYITNYDIALWDLLIEALLGNNESIHFFSRGLLFADFHVLIDQGYDVSSTIFLRLTAALQNETEVNVWDRANLGILRITNRLRGTVLLGDHLSYLRNIMAPLHGRMLNDESFNSELATHIRFWSCISLLQNCIYKAHYQIMDAMETGDISSDLCDGFRTVNETVLTHFWNVALEATNSDREVLLNALACSGNVDFLRTFSSAALDLTNNLTRADREIIINRVYQANFVGFDFIDEFVMENHEIIHSEIMDIGEYLARIATFANSECEAEKVLLLARLIPATSAFHRETINSILAPNLRWRNRNFDELQEFYENILV